MGKGDRKTRRGKTYRGSYGNTRVHTVQRAVAGDKTAAAIKPIEAKKSAPKKKSA